ncbi:recombination regulator RecX [Lacticaseibacillus hegangensis]|uniref:Regulatory protein RecX n=1 Tax=Lacticaseibacillus hegangensis TaxID=2486010 RepID=A0ABW4D1K7_9LACO|nr:recombination regulator RecX [Lacticaseibacillus hegangensis]
MQTITKISAQKRRGRYNIFLDGKYAFAVSEGTLVKYRLIKGLTLEPEAVKAVQAAEVAAVANATALNFISHQPRTVHEVRDRLRQDEVPEEVIKQVTDHLKAIKLLDDAQYADILVRDNLSMGERGPRQVEARLREKGVHPDVAAQAVAGVTAEQWRTVADRVAKKAARRTQHKPFKDQQNKIRQALMQKGFDGPLASEALAALALEPDAEQETDLLTREAEKQWRLKRKYTGYDRRNRVKQALVRKGFDYDAIDAVIARLEAEA